MHTTDSHGGIKVCDSSHEAISYPALLNQCSCSLGEYKRRDEGDVHGRCISDKGVPSSAGLCLGYVCRRVFGWLGLLVRFSFTVSVGASTFDMGVG